MKAQKTIYLSLYYHHWDRLGYTDVNQRTAFSFCDDSRIDTLLEFQQDSKKIVKEAIKLAEDGCSFRLSVSIDTIHSGEDCTCYGWTASDPLSVAEDDNGKKYIHLDADTSTSTPEWWDMVLYPDLLKSLAEAHC